MPFALSLASDTSRHRVSRPPDLSLAPAADDEEATALSVGPWRSRGSSDHAVLPEQCCLLSPVCLRSLRRRASWFFLGEFPPSSDSRGGPVEFSAHHCRLHLPRGCRRRRGRRRIEFWACTRRLWSGTAVYHLIAQISTKFQHVSILSIHIKHDFQCCCWLALRQRHRGRARRGRAGGRREGR